MDWFHCNRCFLQRGARFSVTTCGHVLCQRCGAAGPCVVCGAQCRTREVGNQLHPDQRRFFRSPTESATRALTQLSQVWRFQAAQAELRVTRQREAAERARRDLQEAQSSPQCGPAEAPPPGPWASPPPPAPPPPSAASSAAKPSAAPPRPRPPVRDPRFAPSSPGPRPPAPTPRPLSPPTPAGWPALTAAPKPRPLSLPPHPPFIHKPRPFTTDWLGKRKRRVMPSLNMAPAWQSRRPIRARPAASP
ncbi:E3 ubiquitin-protein ligase RNF212B isoform X2 [Patagioenas fasciata]|uniref:E3 ubiquitin-protein ligase RNF212B isoform X2 n=1 Tax=Patagioenas fasciata TaxID=372321 RepID=UPI003A9A5701